MLKTSAQNKMYVFCWFFVLFRLYCKKQLFCRFCKTIKKPFGFFCKNASFCVSFVKYCVKTPANASRLRIFTCILIQASLVYYSSTRKRSANVSRGFCPDEFSSKILTLYWNSAQKCLQMLRACAFLLELYYKQYSVRFCKIAKQLKTVRFFAKTQVFALLSWYTA